MKNVFKILILIILCLVLFFQINNTKEDNPKLYYQKEEIRYDRNIIEHSFDIKNLLQTPELPTGCEVTSLTMVLNHMGYDIDKCTLADQYLPKGKIGETDFHQAFIGNPRDEVSYGCYVDVIESCAHKYLASVTAKATIKNLTGKDFENLFGYIQNDIPVIVWTTMSLIEPYETTEWYIDGKEVSWLANEHCVVLRGYDEGYVYVCDPLKGNVRYDKVLFEKRYTQLHSQAMVIY